MTSSADSFWSEIKVYEERLQKNPASYCFAPLAEVYLKAGLLDDALAVARAGVARYPCFVSGQLALARICHQKGLVDECRRALEVVTGAVPEQAEAQRLLARLYDESGHLQEAICALQTLLEFCPDNMSARLELDTLQSKSDDDLELIEFTEADIVEEFEEESQLVERVKPIVAIVEDPWAGVSSIPEPEPEPIPVPEFSLEIAPEPEPVPEPEPEMIPVSEFFLEPAPEPEPVSVPAPEPETVAVPELSIEIPREPAPEPEPVPEPVSAQEAVNEPESVWPLPGQEFSAFAEPEEQPLTDLDSVWAMPEQQLVAVDDSQEEELFATSDLAGLIAEADTPNQDAVKHLAELEQTSAAEAGQAAVAAAEQLSSPVNLPAQGVSDQQAKVMVLEGWLENIRRLRSCR